MKINKFIPRIPVCLASALVLAGIFSLSVLSCTKMEMESEDMIQVAPSEPEEEDKPSKYKDGDLVSMVFTLDDQEQEEVKVSLGDTGTGAAGGDSRRVYWNEGDSVMFVWGPDEEDRCIGVAMLAGDLQTDVKATFNATVFKDAKAVYAVSPASAFYSFTESNTYDTDGTGTVRVDTRVQRGDFGGAYICVARTSLESRKMRFKSMLAYVAVNPTQPAFGGFGLDGGSLKLGGVLPVTASMDGDFTGALSTGSWEQESAVVKTTSGKAGEKAYIAVKPGTSFAGGIALSYLDAGGATVGKATLQKNQTVQKGRILEFGDFLNARMAKDYYVKLNGSGNKDGSSWDNAWDLEQMQVYVEDNTKYEAGSLTAEAPINIHIEEGNYNLITPAKGGKPYVHILAKYTSSEKTDLRPLNLLGGYPSGITDAKAANMRRDASKHKTIFISNNVKDNGNRSHVVYMEAPIKCAVSGIAMTGNVSTQTGSSALYVLHGSSLVNQPLQCMITDCHIYGNTNTQVSAAATISTNVAEGLNDIRIENCLFENNTAGAGAAINFDGNSNRTKVTNCVFSNNVAIKYAGTQGCGGAVKISRGALTFTDCKFLENSVASGSLGGGGAVWITDETGSAQSGFITTFKNCLFENNHTDNEIGKGGAVLITRFPDARFEDCIFKGNTCNSSSVSSYGGAIMCGAVHDGDASHVQNNVGLTLTRCTFDDNRVTVPSLEVGKYIGGASLFVYQPDGKTTTVNVNDCIFKNHLLPMVEGLAIYGHSGKLNITNTTFENNSNAYDAGGKNEGNIPNGHLLHSSPAIYVKNANTIITNSEFTNNRSNAGGALFMSGTGTLTMSDTKFTNNVAYGSGAPALRVSSTGLKESNALSITDCEFDKNSSEGYGGAVAIYKDTDATFKNCTFTNNHTTSRAGACYVGGEDGAVNTVNFTDCTFEKNYSNHSGGAIDLSNVGCQGYTQSVESSDLTGANLADTLINVSFYKTCKANMNLTNCTFTENYSTSQGGGAVSCQTSGKVTITDCNFKGNYTKNGTSWSASGGALSLAFGCVGESVSAGVITNPVAGDFEITGCTFDGNHTENGQAYQRATGGAIVVSCGARVGNSSTVNPCTVKIFQCNFLNNYATQGGALSIYSEEANTYISNCLFYKNYVHYAIGPHIQRFHNCTGGLYINNSTFKGGWAKGKWNCAYINVDDGPFVFANSTIIGQPETADGVKDVHTTEGLFRFDCIGNIHSMHFINSIICNTNEGAENYGFVGYKTKMDLFNDKPETGARGFMTTIMSPPRLVDQDPNDLTNEKFFELKFPNEDGRENANKAMGGSNKQTYGTSNYFPNLKWNCNTSAPTYKDSYWSWSVPANNCLPKGGYISTVENMNKDLNNTAPEFYSWLVSKGVVSSDFLTGYDQRGNKRGTHAYCGAYDGGDR